MEDQRPPAELLQGAAAVACASCRRLKMRCIGAANPPCVRCLKSNRECVVRLPNRNQSRRASRSQAASSLVDSRPSPAIGFSPASSAALPPNTGNQTKEPSHRPASARQNLPLQQSILPSIYSSSPIAIAATKVSGSESPSGSVATSHSELRFDAMADSVIADLVEFFLQRLIYYTPTLSLEPMADAAVLILRQRPLAYAMAFVASTVTVGYVSTRLALFPHMLRMLEQASDVMNDTQEENWTLLQALAVVYSYPKVGAISEHAGEKRLSPWAVKSAVETCAMQLSLHQSVEDLKTLVESSQPNITTSLPFRRAFYWLWLFVKSRHHSIITRTPPTIQNDSTIATVLDLLSHLDLGPGLWRVLAEAALHHQWDRAARSDKGLAEWWCVPSSTKDVGSLSELLENADTLLQEWSSTWLQSNDMGTPASPDSGLLDPSVFANTITAFMGILTRFSIISFSAPIVSHQLVAKTGLATFPPTTEHSRELSAFLDCVLKSADAASQCCDIILQLKPAARETLRYTPDPGFTMIALCCLHLIYAYNMSPDNPTLRSYLAKAEQVAYLMMDLSVGYNSCPKTYGEYVLLQLRRATQSSILSTGSFNDDQSMTDLQHGGAMSHHDSHTWSQLGHGSNMNPPLDSLFPVGLSNNAWPVIQHNTEPISPPNHTLFDLFNLYPDPQLHTNTNLQ